MRLPSISVVRMGEPLTDLSVSDALVGIENPFYSVNMILFIGLACNQTLNSDF